MMTSLIKKLLSYFFLFIAFIFLNFVLVNRSLALARKESTIELILAQFELSSAPPNQDSLQAGVSLGDSRAANLKAFFRRYNSPLYDYTNLIVQVSDQYQFDYRLLPAIAMQESNLCRVVPDDSHNCWGWGIYGTTVTKFDSYDEAIKTVAEGIKKEYIDKGLVTASMIMQKYTPASPGSWAHGVNTFLKALE